jgi:hypothetical protein
MDDRWSLKNLSLVIYIISLHPLVIYSLMDLHTKKHVKQKKLIAIISSKLLSVSMTYHLQKEPFVILSVIALISDLQSQIQIEF